MAAGPARVPLTGADCFLRAFDHEIRRRCRASHVSQLVLRLGPGFDVEGFAKLVGEVARAQPILRAPIRRPFGIGAPVYRLDAAPGAPLPAVSIHDVAGPRPAGDALPEVFSERLNQLRSARRGELLGFDAVRYDGGAAGTDLAASWLHMLLDGSGSEGFVRWLDACSRGEASPGQLPQPDELAPRPREVSFGEAGDGARRWQRWVEGFAAHSPRSPAGPLRSVRQQLGYAVETLSPEATTRAVERAKASAGFLTPMLYYLAIAIRAHHAAMRERGETPGSYLVPLPVNARPKGGAAAIFRTHVSLLWFQVLPEQVDELDELVGVLKQQRIDAVRAGHVEGGLHAMDFARYAPRRLYSHLARRRTRGELCSFFFAYTGEFLDGLTSFLGAPIENGFHVAPVPPSPGSCLAISHFAGRLNATHVHQAGAFTPDELTRLHHQLRHDL